MKTIVVMTSGEMIQITEKEYEALLKFREKEAHKEKLHGYIEEFNDLVARAKKDGFTFGVNVEKKGISSFCKATEWNDASNSWIRLI